MFISANCCKMLLISIDQCKVKMRILKQKSGRTLIGKTLFALQNLHIFVFNFFTLLIHRQFVFSSTNSSGRPEVHFDVVVSF